jgi:CMP/dCMP kinase
MLQQECIVVAIDGPAGSGKSTLARGLALRFGFAWLDSGSTYRALAYKAIKEGISPDDSVGAEKLALSTDIEYHISQQGNDPGIFLDGVDITSFLRSNEISSCASAISRHPSVRDILVTLQRNIAKQLASEVCRPESGSEKISGVVVEGRDIGTVVFPDAFIKFFLTASIEERACRRAGDFDKAHKSLQNIECEILARDSSDRNRPTGAMVPASDAILIDNTGWSVDETLLFAAALIESKLKTLLDEN